MNVRELQNKLSDYQRVIALAKQRGMKVSRAAARLGFDSSQCKGMNIASKMMFATTAEEMAMVVRDCGHSCMSATPESYRYWYATGICAVAYITDSLKCLAHPSGDIRRGARCLIRTDNFTFVQAYGPRAGEITLALETLGYTRDAETFSKGLDAPKNAYKEYTFDQWMPVPHPKFRVLCGILWELKKSNRDSYYCKKGKWHKVDHAHYYMCAVKGMTLRADTIYLKQISASAWQYSPPGGKEVILRNCKIKPWTTRKPFTVKRSERISPPFHDGTQEYLR